MESFLLSSWYSNIVLPILFVILGVLANRLGRQDNDVNPKRNLWAVGTPVLLMSLGTLLSEIGKSESNIQAHSIWLTIFLFLLFLSIDIDRYGSWVRDEEGNPTNYKKVFTGIICPDIISVIAFYIYRISV